MKKYAEITGFILLALVVALSTTVFASSNVRFTVHNLSNNNNATEGMTTSGAGINRKFYSSEVDQVCIFCHTPHNAQPANPLWNKSASLTPAGSFALYTSSASLSTETKKNSKLTAASPSMLCLSCHDGRTAINVLHNSGQGISASAPYSTSDKLVDIGASLTPTTIDDGFGFGLPSKGNLGATTTDINAGTNLTNDHPIGFTYSLAQAEKLNSLNDLTTVGTKSANRVRFFGGKMECSSCHDPHVSYEPTYGGDARFRPFLVMENTGSKLCLACHNK